MELKFKRLKDDAVLPIRAKKGDAGLDLTCTDVTTTLNEARQLMIVYHTDLAVEIPEGYVGLLFPRSSIWKKSLLLTDCVGVIDSGYRGEIMAVMKATTDVVPAVYNKGERFAQLVIMPYASNLTITEATELSDTDRGENGFGSTGSNNEEKEAESEAEQTTESNVSSDDAEQIEESK